MRTSWRANTNKSQTTGFSCQCSVLCSSSIGPTTWWAKTKKGRKKKKRCKPNSKIRCMIRESVFSLLFWDFFLFCTGRSYVPVRVRVMHRFMVWAQIVSKIEHLNASDNHASMTVPGPVEVWHNELHGCSVDCGAPGWIPVDEFIFCSSLSHYLQTPSSTLLFQSNILSIFLCLQRAHWVK